MSQSISLWGANYTGVGAVKLPKTGGGTASFTDVTDTTAAAGDVASGKYFYTSAGVRTAGTASGGGGDWSHASKTATLSATSQTLTFTGLSGTPKAWYVRATSQISSSGSTTIYYIVDACWDGSSVVGNSFRIGSTRRIYNVTSGITQSYSGGTLTITGASGTGSSPGQFYAGGYTLVYWY